MVESRQINVLDSILKGGVVDCQFPFQHRGGCYIPQSETLRPAFAVICHHLGTWDSESELYPRAVYVHTHRRWDL